ncbi:hypothetical protein TNCV_2917261 [Trichonephila clavipes]|nr:hypothetical protein TNCV_2917261 [Trichonephila clavipes]
MGEIPRRGRHLPETCIALRSKEGRRAGNCNGTRENTLGMVRGLPPLFPFHQPHKQKDLWLDGYLEYPHAAKALYIYKHPCLLRDANPGPLAQQSASLTAIPNGQHCLYVTEISEGYRAINAIIP